MLLKVAYRIRRRSFAQVVACKGLFSFCKHFPQYFVLGLAGCFMNAGMLEMYVIVVAYGFFIAYVPDIRLEQEKIAFFQDMF